MTPVLFEFLTPGGEPIANMPFYIQLERSDQEENTTGIILPRLIESMTDADGKVIVPLAPTNARYHVTMLDRDGGAALHHDFYVPFLNNPETVVALADLIVARDATLSHAAYDEAALLVIQNAKAQALASATAAAASAASSLASADFADDAIGVTVLARDAAQLAAASAIAARDAVLGGVQGAHDYALLAEDHAAAALQSKNEAATSAGSAATSLASATTQAGLANQSAVDAQGSEDAANAARDAANSAAFNAASAKTASETARDVTVAARDVTIAARDVTNSARDTAVQKAAQLASQLFAFNEIYIGKFAVAPLVDGNGGVLKVGAIYENTTLGKIFQWEADLTWHAYDEEAQLHLNNAILSANNAAASAASALTNAQNAGNSAFDAESSAGNASGSSIAAAESEAAALTAKNAAAISAGDASASESTALSAASMAIIKADESAASAAAALDYLGQAQAGQVQSDWTQADVANKGFIKNKPLLSAVATSGAKADVGLGNVDNISAANMPVSAAQATAIGLKQDSSAKDAANGYVGLSGFKAVLKNAAGTVASLLASGATVVRTWTFPDKDGTVAMTSDITGTNSGVNTGDETAAGIRAKLGATAVTGSNTGDETNATILTKLNIPSISGTNTGDQTLASLGAQAALGYTPINSALIGASNGVTPLDATGKVPATFLPAFVDDVLEYASVAALPGAGVTGVIYVTTDAPVRSWRWGGSAYAEISAAPGSTDAVAEGAANLYFTVARVRATLLAGIDIATSAVIAVGDTVLSALGKLQAQITGLNTNKADKTGGNASGTWPISVAGSSATIGGYAPDSTGTVSTVVIRDATGAIAASGVGGFGSSTFAANVRNPIWRFMNSPNYGLSYFQGTSGWGGGASDDTVGIHFGTATSAGSPFQFHYTGKAKFGSGLDLGPSGNLNLNANSSNDCGDIVWWNYDGTERHRLYDSGAGSLGYRYAAGATYALWHAGNLTGLASLTNNLSWINGEYIGGGQEKPNYFGANRLKLQMLQNNNIPSPTAWNDVLWMSSYGGGDVPGSNALIMGKTGEFFGFAKQDFNSGAWGTLRTIWHTGNLVPPSVSAAGDTLVQRTVNGYIFGNYINLTDDGNPGSGPGAVTSIITKQGDDYYRSTTAVKIKTFLAYTGANIDAPRTDHSKFIVGAMELAWKNYGNNHTIFDASQGTAPNGAAINNTNSTNAWSGSFPTLMGWNGSQTYGVRVDSARIADVASSLNFSTVFRVDTNGVARGSYGSISVHGLTNTYAGIDFTDVNMTFMSNGTTMGCYVNNNAWAWQCDYAGNFTVPGNVTAYSDERLKKNWRDVPENFVALLAGIKHGTYDRIDIKETQDGVSAQDAQKILPNSVRKVGKFLTLNYGGFAAVSAVKLAQKAMSHEQQIADLTALVQSLATRVKELETK